MGPFFTLLGLTFLHCIYVCKIKPAHTNSLYMCELPPALLLICTARALHTRIRFERILAREATCLIFVCFFFVII